MSVSIGEVFDDGFDSVREFDMTGNTLVINPKNLDTIMTCLKTYYKLKIDMFVPATAKPIDKIVLLNRLLTDIHKKLETISLDPANLDKLCITIVGYVIRKIEIINSEVLPLISGEFDKPIDTPLILKLYKSVKEIETKATNICKIIESSFSKVYENVLFEKAKCYCESEKEQIIKMCFEETCKFTNITLTSYETLCVHIKNLLKIKSEFEIQSVGLLTDSKILECYEIYSVVFVDKSENMSYDNCNTDQLFVMLNTILLIKSNLVSFGAATHNVDIIGKYCESEKMVKSGVVGKYFSKIFEIITKTFSKDNIFNQSIIISNAIEITTLLYNIKCEFVDKSVVSSIFESTIIAMTNCVTHSMISLGEKLFDKQILENINIFFGEICGISKKITGTTHIDMLFKKINLTMKFAMLEGNAIEIKDEFIACDKTLYESLCKIKKSKSPLTFHKRTNSDASLHKHDSHTPHTPAKGVINTIASVVGSAVGSAVSSVTIPKNPSISQLPATVQSVNLQQPGLPGIGTKILSKLSKK